MRYERLAHGEYKDAEMIVFQVLASAKLLNASIRDNGTLDVNAAEYIATLARAAILLHRKNFRRPKVGSMDPGMVKLLCTSLHAAVLRMQSSIAMSSKEKKHIDAACVMVLVAAVAFRRINRMRGRTATQMNQASLLDIIRTAQYPS